MSTKTDFPEDEWTRILRAPFVAGLAISLADPGGPIEAAKETMATVKSSTNPPSREQLLAEVALEHQCDDPAAATTRSRDTGRPRVRHPGEQVLEELREVQDDRRPQGDARGGGGLRAVAARDGAGRCRRGQGRRLHGLRRQAGQRGRAGDAGSSARGARRLTHHA